MKPFDDGDEADALAHAAELALAGEPREEIERELPPPGPRAPVIDQQALARSIAGGIAKAFAGERERDLERIGGWLQRCGQGDSQNRRGKCYEVLSGIVVSSQPSLLCCNVYL